MGNLYVNIQVSFDLARTATRVFIREAGNVIQTNENFGAVSICMVFDESLEVTTLSPADEATNVALDADVTVTFNQDISATDLSGITFAPTVSGISASVSGAVLTITHDGFAEETEYTVTIPAGTIEGFGEAITWSFTTEPGTGLPSNILNNIQVYPNPVRNEMRISTDQTITKIVVLDLQGRIVLQQDGDSRTVDMQTVLPGIYIVQIHTEAGIVPMRIVKSPL
jgi:hypothetical protein